MSNSFKQISKVQSGLFLLGGALMVIGAGCFVFYWHRALMCWLFLAGAVMFSTIQAMHGYEGQELVVRRLMRIQSLAGLLFIVSGILLADTCYGFFKPLFANYMDYLTYVYNKWVITLLVAAVLEVYTVHRIDHELSKKNIKG